MTNVYRISPGWRRPFTNQLITELAADQERRETGTNSYHVDLVDWAHANFYVPTTEKLVVMPPHQICVLRYLFTRDAAGHFPFSTVVYSSVKKSGKSTAAAIAARWMAETQVRYGELYAIGNDANQAKDRSFREVRYSLELTPGYDRRREVLPGRWVVQKTQMRCLLSGTEFKALAVDAKGEAGGKPAFQVWTELWGGESTEAKRFWDELTPVPTIPDSLRMVETYAGFDGESTLLRSLYDLGLAGRQLTAGEIAAVAARDKPGETYEELLHAFAETEGNPDAYVPLWVNDDAGFAMYWDSGLAARRMPWQHEYVGENERCRICHQAPYPDGHNKPPDWVTQYYREQEATEPAPAYRRHHLNEWVGAESEFVHMTAWDGCYDASLVPLAPGDKTPVVLGVDAGVVSDCFAVVAVSRHPERNAEVAVREEMLLCPEKGMQVNLLEAENFIRHVCTNYNVVQVAYDPWQLEDMMQRLRRDGVAWCKPFKQGPERLVADRQLHDLIISRRVWHRGQPDLRDHIANSRAKHQSDEDSKLRIVKKSNDSKIDLVVALSMAANRCLKFMGM